MPVVVGRSILRPTQTSARTATPPPPRRPSGLKLSRTSFSSLSSIDSGLARDENTPKSTSTATAVAVVAGRFSPFTPDSSLGPSPHARSPSADLLRASPRPPRKCVQWRDVHQGAPLSTEKTFRATDEAWRCSPKRHPLFTLTSSPPPTRSASSSSPIFGVGAGMSVGGRARASPTPLFSLSSYAGTATPTTTPTTTTAAAAAAAVSEESFTFASTLPGSRDEVLAHLGAHGVQLEHAFVQGRQLYLTARVLNICFEKNVFARITTNNWLTHVDVSLQHQLGLSDPRTDAFSSVIELTGPAQIALCFRGANGIEHWDNNGGANYHVVAVSRPASSTRGGRDSPAAAASA